MTQIIDLGKLRFSFAGEWLNTTVYESNDVVRYGGNVYVYTYALKTSANLPTNAAYWALMVEGINPQGVYAADVAYAPGDTVTYGGNLYRALGTVTNVLPDVTTSWGLLLTGFAFLGSWASGTAYKPNEVVQYGGNSYISLAAHASGAFSSDLAAAKWKKFNSGIRWRGAWAAGTAYLPDDVVTNGANTLLAKVAFTSSDVSAATDGVGPAAEAVDCVVPSVNAIEFVDRPL